VAGDGRVTTQRAPRPPLPRSLYVETSSRCNSKCQTCILTFGGREPARDLTLPEFRRIVDQFPVLERVVLHGIGEPLLVRDLPAMISHAKARGAHVLFNSNAITLTGRWQAALVDAGLDELRVSLDASAPETYARIRGVDALEKVVANLEAFATYRQERGVARPAVSLWFTGMHDNLHELPGLVPIAARAGGAEIHLQRLVYNGLGLAVEAQSLYGRLSEAEARVIRETAAAAAAAGLVFSASGATTPEVSLTPHGASTKPWSHCRRPWMLVYVTVHGNVLPCCISPWVADPYEGSVLGNLYEQSLEEIWWGGGYAAFRQALLTEAPPQPCRGCWVFWSL
jgi:MoaA/NifB/PqqE/SkfB family radical SAM enzyme